jgi:hypothetical protein
MDERPSLMRFYPLWRSANGLMARFLAITVVLIIWGVGQMVIIFSMTILLHHGEVPCCVVLISQRSSSFANLPFVKSLLEHYATFLSFLSSY